MSKTLSVSAIENGTVIDHIFAGQALRIFQLLKLFETPYRVTIGMNLSSRSLKTKDLIKIEDYTLSNEQANEITVFSPYATINIIKNYEVVNKITTRLPESVVNAFVCPNGACITHIEALESHFFIEDRGKQIKLRCKFCEKSFDRNVVKVSL